MRRFNSVLNETAAYIASMDVDSSSGGLQVQSDSESELIAVVIFLRLRNVLGRRTGSERPPFDPYSRREAAPEEPLMARCALHAWKLEINHPKTDERMTFEAPLPDDMQNLLDNLRKCMGQRPIAPSPFSPL